MKAVVKTNKPLLTKRHRKERMDFPLAHLDWTVEDWKRVVWSDETKINRVGSDGIKWAWKKPGEQYKDQHMRPAAKFGGGNVIMWGCMTWHGTGYACRIDGRIDAELYCQILADE